MAKYDITLIRGDDEALELEFFDKEANAALDLTGMTVFFTVKFKLSDKDSDAVIDIEQTAHDDPENGKTVINITNQQTKVRPGGYHYDIRTRDSQGKVKSIKRGLLEIKQAVRNSL